MQPPLVPVVIAALLLPLIAVGRADLSGGGRLAPRSPGGTWPAGAAAPRWAVVAACQFPRPGPSLARPAAPRQRRPPRQRCAPQLLSSVRLQVGGAHPKWRRPQGGGSPQGSGRSGYSRLHLAHGIIKLFRSASRCVLCNPISSLCPFNCL